MTGLSHPLNSPALRGLVNGVHVPSFTELGLPADLVDHLAQRGIVEPFPIQAAALPDTIAGRDVAGRAPTGSGKTLAFGIAIALRVGQAKPRRPRALVLVPTRELAAQVHREVSALAALRGRTVTAVYGGVGYKPQIDALRRGTDVVVACPGRLADLVQRGDVKLDDVELVVLDEADRMADMGFLPEVRRLLDRVRPDRQTLLFSATLDGDVDVLVRRYQRKPVRHELAAAADSPITRHVFWRAEHGNRVELTADLVTREWPAIVFCRTKRGADRLARQLSATGVSATPLHGNLSQSQRGRALSAFTTGRVQALVATDVAARGIHVDDVGCVVHFDPPNDAKDYVHRSGRTGRAGAEGLVVSLVASEQAAAVRKMQGQLALPRGIDVPDIAGLRDANRRPVFVAPVLAPAAAVASKAAGKGPGAASRSARPPRRRRRSGANAGGRKPSAR